jgi:hypothetical protein
MRFSDLFRRSKAPDRSTVPAQPRLMVCDICNGRYELDAEWSMLSTKEVVSSTAWWEYVFDALAASGRDPHEINPLLLVGRYGRSDTAWKCCPRCSRLFRFDARESRRRMETFLRTGDSGSGFALCTYEDTPRGPLIRNLDDEGMMHAVSASGAAYRRKTGLSPRT